MRIPLTCLPGMVLAWTVSSGVLEAQTIRGTLVDGESGRSIPFGLILMFTEAGDSVTATTSDRDGAFRIASESPGSFTLRASALGYAESTQGIFELGADGRLDVRYALRAEPMAIDAIIISLDRPAALHRLVRNGFVTRYQRGLGLFVTPYDIERSSARSTEQLLSGLPGVRIGPVYRTPATAPANPDTAILIIPEAFDETVLIQTTGGWCPPTLYVDGGRTHYDPEEGFTLSSIVGIDDIEAIEVYRRPAEIPVEYRSGTGAECGVLVAWTNTGLAAGQRPSGSPIGSGTPGLPPTSETGPPPAPGETIRVLLTSAAGLVDEERVVEGEVVEIGPAGPVVRDPVSLRNRTLPLGLIDQMQVRRPNGPRHAFVRAGLAGSAMAVGTWAGLTFLCEWSDCAASVENPWIPAAIAGSFAGWLVYRKGPGYHWVRTTLPTPAPSGGGVELAWRVSR